jgi:hypothetical protein
VTSVVMEDFFPFEVPPGNHSTMDNWRKMARLWCADGVVHPDASFMPSERYPLSAYGWDWNSGACSIAPGACWVNGFYGQNDTAKALQVGAPPDWGLVCARYDPVAQLISIVYKGGSGPTDLIRDPAGWWEVPLAQMNTDGSIADLRRLVPLPDLTPQLPEIPAWVPRGMLPQGAWGWAFGPAGTWDIVGPTTADLLVIYPAATHYFIPGRAYRFTGLAAPERWADGQGQPDFRLSFWVSDDRGLLYDETLLRWNQIAQGSALNGNPFAGAVTIGGTAANLMAGLRLVVNNAGNIIRFAQGSLVLSCEDAGV